MTVPPLWAKPSEAKTRKKKEQICTSRKPKLKKKNLGKRKNLETTQKKTQKTQKVNDKTLYKLVQDRREKKFWHRAGNTSKNNSYPPHNHDSPSPSPNTTKTPTQPQHRGHPRPQWSRHMTWVAWQLINGEEVEKPVEGGG